MLNYLVNSGDVSKLKRDVASDELYLIHPREKEKGTHILYLEFLATLYL